VSNEPLQLIAFDSTCPSRAVNHHGLFHTGIPSFDTNLFQIPLNDSGVLTTPSPIILFTPNSISKPHQRRTIPAAAAMSAWLARLAASGLNVSVLCCTLPLWLAGAMFVGLLRPKNTLRLSPVDRCVGREAQQQQQQQQQRGM
jgi:hypothetical protein